MANVEETTLVFVSANNNNNKFYRVELNGDTVTKTWGRVGATGTSSSEASGRVGYDRIIREKTRKGYKATETVASTTSQGSNNRSGDKNSAELKSIAIKTLLADASNNVLVQLIDTLVAKNNHAILEASGGQMKVNEDGLITTALGLVSRANIARARVLLADLQATTNELTRMTILEEYLTLVPQKVGSRRGWHKEFISTPEEFSKQTDFLKQLDESLGLHEDRKKAALAAANGTNATADDLVDKYADLFKFKISLLEDTKEFARINEIFEKGKQSIHASSHLKLKRVYVIDNSTGRADFEKKVSEIGNVHELWHGTRVWNILSILRRGLMISAENLGTVQINGKMFGEGAYFAVGSGESNFKKKIGSVLHPVVAKDSKTSKNKLSNIGGSSKALNYAQGYWDGRGRDNNCFMFLADVAMGDVHIAKYGVNYGSNNIQRAKSHDSIHAKGRESGVRNDEIIVWDPTQINLKYLCEFSL